MTGKPISPADAPRWAWHSASMSAVLTASVFLALPYLELLSSLPARKTILSEVATARTPPPPAPEPKRKSVTRSAVERRTPKPKLQKPRPTLIPMKAALSLDLALGNMAGDFALDFPVRPDVGLASRDMVFALSDIDKVPQARVRLQPVYPVHARMRRVEGLVVVEFVVGEDGRTREIRVVHSQPGNVFVNAAVRAVRRWRFRPGTKDGRPVAVRLRQKFTFRLED